MPQQQLVAVENNFTKGLITESTGLNFPENAATDTDNCEYSLIGDVNRRQGIDLEENFSFVSINRTNVAIDFYKWNNAGGDGLVQLLVTQVGSILYFWSVTAATTLNPVSQNKLASTVDLSTFVAAGGTFDPTLEANFTDGNGYLFIFHPNCDPVYCTYNSGTITGNRITVQVRDFIGVPEIGVPDNLRPSQNFPSHNYNLQNQGWTQGNVWFATSGTTMTASLGVKVFTITGGLTINPGEIVNIVGQPKTNETMVGTVTSYVGTTLTVNVTYFTGGFVPQSSWSITPIVIGYINQWFIALANFPSNADQWWSFKNASNVFDPGATVNNVTVGQTAAPKGHYILSAFQQLRGSSSGIPSITDITTARRPTNGTWFQGRVWYTGVNASSPATGTAQFTTWTETIYFSQIVSDVTDFGKCYQLNDPTSETLFDLLPTDGGTIVIQGSGTIYRLFPIANGMIVFAANGVWFITGSQGIGFSANDYTITKISSVQSISCSSYVDVLGLPFFWNEEGVYQVQTQQSGGLAVIPITVGTIQTFFDRIPLSSKKYVRGAYHPIDYIIQWVYKDTEETSVTDRYSFNRILNYNTYNKAFFPYSVDNTAVSINGINYVSGPGGLNTVEPGFKYLSSVSGTVLTFADERDTDYVDWASAAPFNYVSYFLTGYKLRGQAIKRFQPTYIQMYSRVNGVASGYKIQGIWDYANNRSSGKWSTEQLVTNGLTRFDTVFRRHKIRGQGYALQFKITSVDGRPFDIQGWAVADTVNTGT